MATAPRPWLEPFCAGFACSSHVLSKVFCFPPIQHHTPVISEWPWLSVGLCLPRDALETCLHVPGFQPLGSGSPRFVLDKVLEKMDGFKAQLSHLFRLQFIQRLKLCSNLLTPLFLSLSLRRSETHIGAAVVHARVSIGITVLL